MDLGRNIGWLNGCTALASAQMHWLKTKKNFGQSRRFGVWIWTHKFPISSLVYSFRAILYHVTVFTNIMSVSETTNQHISWRRLPLEKLIVAEVVSRFPTCYSTAWSLSRLKKPSYPPKKNLILSLMNPDLKFIPDFFKMLIISTPL
jgi:hypothetical protein